MPVCLKSNIQRHTGQVFGNDFKAMTRQVIIIKPNLKKEDQNK